MIMSAGGVSFLFVLWDMVATAESAFGFYVK